MSTDLRELVEGIVRPLVDDPSQVKVEEVEGEGIVVYQIRVAPEEVGRVIGRRGMTINAIRTLLRAAGGRQGKRIGVEISPQNAETDQ